MINAVVLHSEYLLDAVITTRPSTEQALSSQRREDCSFPPAPRKNNILIKILSSKINPVSTTVNISQMKDIVTNETNRYDSKIST